MTTELYNYGLEVFNGEEEKYKRFLERNKEKTTKEIKAILDKLEYGNY